MFACARVGAPEVKESTMKSHTRAALFILLGLSSPIMSGCALASGDAVGAAAVDYFSGENVIVKVPNDKGLVECDCHDSLSLYPG